MVLGVSLMIFSHVILLVGGKIIECSKNLTYVHNQLMGSRDHPDLVVVEELVGDIRSEKVTSSSWRLIKSYRKK